MHFEREFAGEDYDGKNELKINVMKKTYHLCLSSEDEVMFRDTEDYNRGFNCFALALHKTGSTGLADAFMSNHFHIVVQTENPDGFMGAIRMPYCKYFNAKYGRTGRLGEKNHFCIAVEGLHHHLAVISYVFRNPLHHGMAPIAYAYPHSSVNAIFMKEMGKKPESCLLPQKSFYRHIGRRSDFPDSYRMSDDGLFLRESVIDVVQVENMFATPRTFDYYMNRKSSEEWTAEQEKDRNGASPVTLADIEYGITLNPLNQMLINEGGKGKLQTYVRYTSL